MHEFFLPVDVGGNAFEMIDTYAQVCENSPLSERKKKKHVPTSPRHLSLYLDGFNL